MFVYINYKCYICSILIIKKKTMLSEFKMQEATNNQEAITSILFALKSNELFLNKCSSLMFAVISNLHTTEKRRFYLNLLTKEEIKNLFIEIKTAYYNSKDYSLKF